ncbi:hypothetical protein SAMN05216388_1003345 [Halorientalis persicus]|jgi:hypothetical protein|uniref:DUF7260 domain-containing protein n=1 Tax=Halorientalis persicus TaxID=1367881 RepID=A0A1H8HD40_9EURY|nr:hypothetical protein [Halorientalis persicus]SEN53797.1 hypothetical protein SAMN05216388_1003345 [Halorientalis persicus]
MPGTTHPLEPLDAARTRLRVRRRRLVDERDAFDRFCRRVETLPTAEAVDVPDAVLAVTTRTERGPQALRATYDETVLTVPHIDEDDASIPPFDDLLSQSTRAELRWAARLTPALRAAVLDDATAAHERRVDRIGAVDAELATLDRTEAVARDLLAVESSTDPATDDEARLASLDRRCRRHAARRRARLARRADADTPPLPPDFYGDLDVADPVLSVLDAVRDLLPRVTERSD